MSDEHWLAVVGWQGLYEVSNRGRVRSLDRIQAPPRRGRPGMRPGTILSPNERRVTLHRDGAPHRVQVHHLVLEAFVGPRPQGAQGLHRDDDWRNNDPSNLYWGSRSDNKRDEIRNGRNFSTNKSRCKWDHEYTPENTYYDRHGHRSCRTCRHDAALRRRNA